MEGPANPSRRYWLGRRVLVVGNTGFKGSWLSLRLHRMGAKVFGLSLPPPTEPSLFALARLDRLIATTFGDIRDLAIVKATLSDIQPEVVFHLAAQPLVRLSYSQPVETFATNVMGTVHVLEAARSVASVRSVVVVTSDKCYENREWPWPYRETEAMGGHDPYSSSKGCAELVTAAYRRSFFAHGHGHRSVGIATARAGNVIGGGDWAADRLLPDCMRALAEGRTIEVRNPHAIRPWQHVLDPRCVATCFWPRSWKRTPKISAMPGTSDQARRMPGLCPGWRRRWWRNGARAPRGASRPAMTCTKPHG